MWLHHLLLAHLGYLLALPATQLSSLLAPLYATVDERTSRFKKIFKLQARRRAARASERGGAHRSVPDAAGGCGV